MIVTIAKPAEADFEYILDAIAVNNPPAAVAIVRALRESCLSLSDMPHRYPLIPGHEESGVRRRRHWPYLIFYKALDASVVILHILHGAVD